MLEAKVVLSELKELEAVLWSPVPSHLRNRLYSIPSFTSNESQMTQ